MSATATATATAATTTTTSNHNMTTNTTALAAGASAATTPLGNDISSTRYRNPNISQTGEYHRPVHYLTKTRRDDTTTNNDSPLTSRCEENSSSGSDDDDDEPHDTLPAVTFVPTQCLFCNAPSPSFDANLAHMGKRHGLFLPAHIDGGARVLAVEPATLVRYLHLVVFGYHECLLCHTRRRTAHAAQQHMMGRGHCRVDLDEGEGEVNEYREFYEDAEPAEEQGASGSDGGSDGGSDFLAGEEEEGEEGEEKGRTAAGKKTTPMSAFSSRTEDNNNNTLRLASGKVLTHRATPPPPRANRRPLAKPKSHSRHLHDADLLPSSLEGLFPPTNPGPTTSSTADNNNNNNNNNTTPDGPDPSAPSSASSSSATQTEASHHTALLTRTERRALSHSSASALTTAVARMSARDRGALAHLSPAERRAVVVAQFRQQDRAAQAERRYRGKLERLPNEPPGGMALWLRVAKYG